MCVKYVCNVTYPYRFLTHLVCCVVSTCDRYSQRRYTRPEINTLALRLQRPQPSRRTSWKLLANPGWQPGFPTSRN